jgi:lipoyl(octanoyl) transferase
MTEIIYSKEPVDYQQALFFMENKVEEIIAKKSQNYLWFLEHNPVYTAGTSAKPEDLLNPQFPVYQVGRGGQFTYHGPGQLVIYVMFDLRKLFHPKDPDLRKFIYILEEWIIHTLNAIGIQGERRNGRVGIWVVTSNGEKKIAAIGIRVKKWVSFHGIAININPNLSHFDGIVPCGINEYGITSLHELGINLTIEELYQKFSQKLQYIKNKFFCEL